MVDITLGGVVVLCIGWCTILVRRELRYHARQRELRDQENRAFVDRAISGWDAAYEERHKKEKSG